MTKRCFACLAMVLCLMAGMNSVVALDCESGILPEPVPPPEGTGEDSCEYREIPFATVSYQNSSFTATWDSDYDVEAAYIVADRRILGMYTPGFATILTLSSKYSRVDVLLRIHDDASEEDFLGLSRVFCKSDGDLVNAWEEECDAAAPLSCSVTSTITCPDGTPRSVTCTGDAGTCSDECSSEQEQACCTSNKTTVVYLPGGGTVVYVEFSTTTRPC